MSTSQDRARSVPARCPYLGGSATLGLGSYNVEVHGFEDCCDGAGRMEFLAHGTSVWTMMSTSALNTCG